MFLALLGRAADLENSLMSNGVAAYEPFCRSKQKTPDAGASRATHAARRNTRDSFKQLALIRLTLSLRGIS